MSIIDMWKKMYHPNIVQLREVFTTKAFGDNCKAKHIYPKKTIHTTEFSVALENAFIPLEND